MKSMGKKIYQRKTDLFSTPTIRTYDVLAVAEACPRPFSVVAKKEVAEIQFLKQVFACMKAYMIDRDDIRQSMQVILSCCRGSKAG